MKSVRLPEGRRTFSRKGMFHVKRMFAIALAASLLLGLLAGCRVPAEEPGPPVADLAVTDLASLAFDHSGRVDQEGLEGLYAGEHQEELTAYAQGAYQIGDAWEDMAVIRATGASAFEIAVVRMEDDSSAVRAATAFMNYLSVRQGDFAGYAPEEADMAANGEILQDGPYAALFICPDPRGASAAVEAALGGGALPAPGSEYSNPPITDVKQLRDLLVSGQGMDGAELELLDGGDPDALNAYMKDAYGLTPDQWEACAVARDEVSAFEAAVLRVPYDWDIIYKAENRLTEYLDAREAQFDPAADQAKLLHRSIVGKITGDVSGERAAYVVLAACADATGALDTLAEATGIYGYGYSNRYPYLDTDPNYPDRCAFTPPNEDDMSLYDTSAIRAAWEKGDPAGLSEYDRAIYDAAEKVLKKVLKGGMSAYEKELALYEWMVKNVDYDWTHQNRRQETPRESFTPYGGLVNHTAVCLGFATTFQLLMDLAGVECITVVGAAHMSSSDHGWNMVRLSGEWYCVDVTWDANAREQGGRGRPQEWNYFNITSDDMAASDHQWDYANTPEAVAGDGGRG